MQAQPNAPSRAGQTRSSDRELDKGLLETLVRQANLAHEALFGRPRPVAEVAELHDRLRRMIDKFPLDRSSRGRVARHEAGHLVVGAAYGFRQRSAEIWRILRPAGSRLWGGETIGSYLYPNNERVLECAAVVALAGPLSDDGAIRTGLGDYLIVAEIAQRVAHPGERSTEIVRNFSFVAVSLVEYFTPEIDAVAAILEKRGRVETSDFDIACIVADVSARRRDLKAPSLRGGALINAIMTNINELIR